MLEKILKGESCPTETVVDVSKNQVRVTSVSDHESLDNDYRGFKVTWIFDYSGIPQKELLRRAAEHDKIAFRARVFRKSKKPEEYQNRVVGWEELLPKKKNVPPTEKILKMGLSPEQLRALAATLENNRKVASGKADKAKPRTEAKPKAK